MRLEYLFAAGFSLLLIIAVGMGFYVQLLNDYDIDIGSSQDYTTSMSKFNSLESNVSVKASEIQHASDSIRDKVKAQDITDSTAENAMYAGAFKATRENPYTGQELIGDALISYEQNTGIFPTAVTTFLISLIGIMTIFGILYFVRGIAPK